MTKHHSILIVGGGTAGLSVASRLCESMPDADIAIVEPSEKHYYQPIWTLVGAGVFDKSVSERDEADFIPPDATWIQERVASFDPEGHAVELEDGTRVAYEQLVVCAGIQLDWQKIKGLEGQLGKDGICSNYSFDTVDSTWRFLQAMQSGSALFTFPATPIKCAGAPQKIMYLADDHLRRRGVRDKCKVVYAAAGAGIFGVAHYAAPLSKIVARKGIETHFRRNLVEVRADAKQAVFENLDTKAEEVLDYELLHVVPPQSAPDFIKRSSLANADGWVEVDPYTLQHTRFPDVFSLGDCSSLPASAHGGRDPQASARLGREPPRAPERRVPVGEVRWLRLVPARDGLRQADPRGVRLWREDHGDLPVRSAQGALQHVCAQGLRAPGDVLERDASGAHVRDAARNRLLVL